MADHPGRCGRAHPRSRGDDSASPFSGFRRAGSSPLAGRRRQATGTGLDLHRLIPARGETTCPWRAPPCADAAHPRSRGDDFGGAVGGDARPGSSPLAGRRQLQRALGQRVRRLIPARGETTTTRPAGTTRRRAHPRSRGDDPGTRPRLGGRLGSSPLAGRRQSVQVRTVRATRLIPARGETTVGLWSGVHGPGAHPRSRGDDPAMVRAGRSRNGSSPLAGRRRVRVIGTAETARLIPARGETTGPHEPHPGCRRAHPRSRGDDEGMIGGYIRGAGSSPLAGRRL